MPVRGLVATPDSPAPPKALSAYDGLTSCHADPHRAAVGVRADGDFDIHCDDMKAAHT